jgi:hypothetical protein
VRCIPYTRVGSYSNAGVVLTLFVHCMLGVNRMRCVHRVVRVRVRVSVSRASRRTDATADTPGARPGPGRGGPACPVLTFVAGRAIPPLKTDLGKHTDSIVRSHMILIRATYSGLSRVKLHTVHGGESRP